MQHAVPAKMLSIAFFFHKCSPAVTADAAICGIQFTCAEKFTVFKQYATSVAMMAMGSTFPRYFTAFGISRPRNIIKGSALSNKVQAPQTAMMMTEVRGPGFMTAPPEELTLQLLRVP